MATTSLMPDISRFHGQDGYIAYSTLPGLPPSIVVLADPIAHPDAWPRLIAEFLRVKGSSSLSGRKTIIFAQTSSQCAKVLSSQGFSVNAMGGETEIDIRAYTLSGQNKRGLRQGIERAKRSGVEITESHHPLSKELISEMKLVSGDFFSHHLPSARSSRFLNRDFLYSIDPGALHQRSSQGLGEGALSNGGSRVFIARQRVSTREEEIKGIGPSTDSGQILGKVKGIGPSTASGQILGFLILDPMKREGRVIGYYANITRTMQSIAHPGTSSLLTHHAMSVIKGGKPGGDPGVVMSLGLSPFHCLLDEDLYPKTSLKLRGQMEWAYSHCNAFYPYQGISQSKSKWGGGSLILSTDQQQLQASYSYPDPHVFYRPVYMCHYKMNPTYDLIRIGLRCGMVDLNIVKNVMRLWEGRKVVKGGSSKAKIENEGLNYGQN